MSHVWSKNYAIFYIHVFEKLRCKTNWLGNQSKTDTVISRVDNVAGKWLSFVLVANNSIGQ